MNSSSRSSGTSEEPHSAKLRDEQSVVASSSSSRSIILYMAGTPEVKVQRSRSMARIISATSTSLWMTVEAPHCKIGKTQETRLAA